MKGLYVLDATERGGYLISVPFSGDKNGKDGMHTLSEFLCILHQDTAEQPVHRNSSRLIFSPL